MMADRDVELDELLRRVLQEGSSLDECLGEDRPVAEREELRALAEVAHVLTLLRDVPSPRASAKFEQRERLLKAATASRRRPLGLFSPVRNLLRSIVARPPWKEALVGASLALILSLFILAMLWTEGGFSSRRSIILSPSEISSYPAGSVTAVAEMITSLPSSLAFTYEPTSTSTPKRSVSSVSTSEALAKQTPNTETVLPTPSHTPTATPTLTRQPSPAVSPSNSLPTMPTDTPTPTRARPTFVSSPTLPAPRSTPTLMPTTFKPSPTATRTPLPSPSPTATATAVPSTPTPVLPPPSPTEEPERRDTPTPPPPLPTATPTERPTLPPTPASTEYPAPTLVLTAVPTIEPTITPPR